MKKVFAFLCGLLFLGAAVRSQTLFIYGGENHDVYLGKFNAGPYDSESIWNKYGKYGSKYRSESIWNAYGTYGSKYNRLSPWNEFSSNPPVLVDAYGKIYGYFTANQYKNGAYPRFAKIIAFICRHHEDMADNPDDWYRELF